MENALWVLVAGVAAVYGGESLAESIEPVTGQLISLLGGICIGAFLLSVI
jgi:hypothetical protein